MLDCVFYVFVNSCEHLKIKNLRFIKHATYGQEKPSCDAWITEGSWDTAVGEESLWLLLPRRMGDLSGFFLGTWSWTGSWSWLVHAESIPHGSEAPPQHRMARGDFEEGQYRFSSTAKNTCNKGLKTTNGLQWLDNLSRFFFFKNCCWSIKHPQKYHQIFARAKRQRSLFPTWVPHGRFSLRNEVAILPAVLCCLVPQSL